MLWICIIYGAIACLTFGVIANKDTEYSGRSRQPELPLIAWCLMGALWPVTMLVLFSAWVADLIEMR